MSLPGRHPVFLLALALAATSVPARAEEPDPFRLHPGLAPAGEGAWRVTLVIEATGGHVWNPDYPFRLEVQPSPRMRSGRTLFGRDDVRVASDRTSATVDLGKAGRATPEQPLRGTVSFGLCTGKVCKVFRDREVVWPAAQ